MTSRCNTQAVCMRENLTVHTRQEVFNATARLIGELAVAGNKNIPPSKTFWVTVSLKDHLGTDSEGDDGHPHCSSFLVPTCTPPDAPPGRRTSGEEDLRGGGVCIFALTISVKADSVSP
jgi:hypothetical protein